MSEAVCLVRDGAWAGSQGLGSRFRSCQDTWWPLLTWSELFPTSNSRHPHHMPKREVAQGPEEGAAHCPPGCIWAEPGQAAAAAAEQGSKSRRASRPPEASSDRGPRSRSWPCRRALRYQPPAIRRACSFLPYSPTERLADCGRPRR